jgi:hypothetical protein
LYYSFVRGETPFVYRAETSHDTSTGCLDFQTNLDNNFYLCTGFLVPKSKEHALLRPF